MPKRGENIRKRKDGRWEGRYKKAAPATGSTRYSSIYGKTYSEVKAKLREIDQKQMIKSPTPKTSLKFKEILRLWEAANHLKHKGATVSKYEYLLERHIIPCLGDLPLSSITTQKLNEFAEQKLTCGRLDRKGGLSPAYVRGMMIIITGALRFAANEELCSPLKANVFKPRIEKSEIQILSTKEQTRFENFLLTNMDETKFGVFLSLNCGFRIGEICALRWNDIDLDQCVIHVRSTVARVKNESSSGTQLIIDRPKTKASLRDVPIYSKLIPIITEARSRSLSPYVISKTPEFVSPRTYDYRFHRLLESCGLPSYKYHTLRHTFATRCIVAGVDVKTLSEILGHTNVSITLNTYVHTSMELKRRQVEKLSKYSA